MHRKRGMLVVLVLVLAVVSVGVIGQEAVQANDDYVTCKFLGDKDDDCDNRHHLKCDQIKSGGSGGNSDCHNEIASGVERLRIHLNEPRGCVLAFAEDDTIDDDCGVGIVPQGFLVDRTYDNNPWALFIWNGRLGG